MEEKVVKKKYNSDLSTFNCGCAVKQKRLIWMNRKAAHGTAYEPTVVEHWANMVTHGVCIIPAIYGAKLMIDLSCSSSKKWASSIYGIALVCLFFISTIFHVVFYSGHFKYIKDLLHRGDRAMIYIFIASSYTPWLLLKPLPIESWTVHLKWGIWILAVLGIVYQQLFHEKFKMLETIFYVVMGVTPSLAVIDMDDWSGIMELQIGGLVYILGIAFFKMDGRIPMAHAIWHMFVIFAAFIHYKAVLNYLIIPNTVAEAYDEVLDMKDMPVMSCSIVGSECFS